MSGYASIGSWNDFSMFAAVRRLGLSSSESQDSREGLLSEGSSGGSFPVQYVATVATAVDTGSKPSSPANSLVRSLVNLGITDDHRSAAQH